MYKLLPSTETSAASCVIRLSDNASIPIDEQNIDYQEFLKQQAEGVKVYAADETIPEGETT
jgi:hypothetical protein